MILQSLSAVVPLRDLPLGELAIRAGAAAGVSLAFTWLASRMRGVSCSGALAGVVISFLLYLSAGPGMFAVLVSVFVLAAGATRFGYSRKHTLGLAEQSDGRDARQVLANTGVASVAALLFSCSRNTIFLAAGCAALAEAAADTVSSELGEAVSSGPRLITTWEPVPTGTDGGISVAGTLAGVFAGLLVAIISALARLISLPAALIVAISATIGMLSDSFLGACLERRRLLTNNAVNFLSTMVAALLAFALVRVLQ